ncbi:MAG: amidase [Rhodospirillales bacterium]|nr:amidase [Rhodospirillales bacterium]
MLETSTQPFEFSAHIAAREIREGRLSSEELVNSCLERIKDCDEQIKAWTFLDEEQALAQARAADRTRKKGDMLPPLHGVPVGIKDIFDTHDMPTENGTVLDAGRQPSLDALSVADLRAAGAVIMGKCVTAEMAVYTPGKTANPHDSKRTPGGSSSGSAAAVAAQMVPLATGTQTGGSVIRPAAFCGVFGFKPTRGTIARDGVLMQSPTLDQLGVFANTVEDTALIAGVLMAENLRVRTIEAPRLAFVKSPVWNDADDETRAAFDALNDSLGAHITEVELPAQFDNAISWHKAIHDTELARHYGPYYERGKDRLSRHLREMIERGQRTSSQEYFEAKTAIDTLNGLLKSLSSGFDAILTPATTGEAPVGLETTGNPVFCKLWTLCGLPSLSMPLLKAKSGMPLGVQLVGPLGQDAGLLGCANWLMERGN